MVNRFVAKYLLLGLVAVGLFATSCVHEKNEYAPESSIIIGYDVKLNNVSDKPATKADDGGMVVGEKIEIERLSEKFGEKNLFLHTITNVWDGSATGGAANGVANGAGYGSDVLTRGAFIKNGQEEGCYSITDKQIAVSAWVYDGDVSGGYTSGQQYFVNDLLESPWSSTRYWPELNDHLRFYAYAPTDVQSGEKNNGAANYVTLPSAWGNACVPSFDFVVPANVEEQSDLLVASAHVKKEVFGSDVNLKFYHALTAVQFMVEDLNGLLIKRVTLSGVKNEETYTYAHNLNGNAASTDAAYDLENGSWSSADATADGEYVLDFTSGELEKADGIESNDGYKFVTGDETPTVYTLNEGNFILFLMPQQLGDDAQITLEGYDEIRGENVTLSGKIGGSGKEWKKGQHIIYKISTSDISVQYVFEVEEVSIDMFQNDIVKEPLPTVEINGQNIVKYVPFYGQLGRKFDVKSYKKTTRLGESEPEITPLVWKIETEIPYWIDRISATSGTGLNNEAGVEEVTYDVIAQTPNCISHNNLNRGFPYNNETVATAYDLSTKGGVAAMNTANCYIVDAPGYYKLPLVYGNAIKDGSYNTVSYIAANPLTEPSSSSYLLPDNTSVTAYYDIMGQFYNYAGDGGWTPGTINDPWININDDIL
ncbi:MAG: fimbrillin family protein, partial [Bacteroidales bacterium]|nr:fimbrillin family protein [Bacteroidales bacterium]